MRVGGTQDLLNRSEILPQIMVNGGWGKADTVIRYVERTGSDQIYDCDIQSNK